MTTSRYAPVVTAKPIQVLVIYPDNSSELKTIEQDLSAFQGLVGGWVEAVITDGAILWADEDGKAKDCPVNTLATYLWWNLNPPMEGHDVLRGPIFVTGLDDGKGNSLPVPAEIIDYFDQMKAIYDEEN